MKKTLKTFLVNNAGCIINTPFLAVLKMKIGTEVVLVHNVKTIDGLTNGARGILVAVKKKKAISSSSPSSSTIPDMVRVKERITLSGKTRM